MGIDRRSFLALGSGLVAATGVAETPPPAAAPRRRAFVGACPPSSRELAGRRPGPTRVMFIGAHPDDADILCGCTAVKMIDRGFKVKFVSVTDGRMGHHRLSPDETARVRRAETLEAARRFGLDGYDIYGYPDCGLYPVAAAAGKSRAVMVANASGEVKPIGLDLGGAKPSSCRIVDADRTWEEVPVPDSLPPHSFAVLSF